MKIKMKNTSAGPEGAKLAGHVYDVPEKEAKELLEGGYAEKAAVEETAEEVKTPPVKVPDEKPEKSTKGPKGPGKK